MVKISEAFPSNYLKAADLQKRTVTVKIIDVRMEDIDSNHKPVLYFDGKDRGLVLNKTNARMIAYQLGDDTDAWVGAEIDLYPTMTSFQGKPVEAIRVNVRPPANGQGYQPHTAPLGNEDRFAPNAAQRRGPGMPDEGRFAPPPSDNDVPF